jgi:hypothetical protein
MNHDFVVAILAGFDSGRLWSWHLPILLLHFRQQVEHDFRESHSRLRDRVTSPEVALFFVGMMRLSRQAQGTQAGLPVGDKIVLNGQVFEGVVKSVVEKTDAPKYNLSFNNGKRAR